MSEPEVSPEPTFLEKLRAAQEGATSKPWRKVPTPIEIGLRKYPMIRARWDGHPDEWCGSPGKVEVQCEKPEMDADLICLLVNNAEKIAALIEAVAEYGDGWKVVRAGDGEMSLVQLDEKPMIAALAALNEEIK